MKKITIFLSVLMVTSTMAAQAEINTTEILNTKCSTCHATPDATQYSQSEWDERINVMSVYAQLSDEEKQALKNIKE
ncbi:MAG: hypothetical protein ACK5LE_00620 [Alphaproteobacteria bacterium]